MDNSSSVVVLLGPPGSGKGTQASRLAQQTGLAPISTGQLLRHEADTSSDIGEQVRGLMSAGLLVGNDLMNQVVAKRLDNADCNSGCILDGYPRTIEQALYLQNLLHKKGISEPIVFDFVVSPEQVIERLSQRRLCPLCGKIYSAEFDIYGKGMICESDGSPLVRRSDDNADAIRERINIYLRNTSDLVELYRPCRYFAVDARQSPDEISARLLSLMNSCRVSAVELPA